MTGDAVLRWSLGTTCCDDFRGYGRLTCFASDRAMKLDLLARGAFAPREAAVVAHQLNVNSWPQTRVSSAKGTCWSAVIVTLWDKQNYKGSQVALFCSYPNLGTIGWADRAQSGKNAYVFQAITLFQKMNYKDAEIKISDEKAEINPICPVRLPR
jgi:hypothetical protein